MNMSPNSKARTRLVRVTCILALGTLACLPMLRHNGPEFAQVATPAGTPVAAPTVAATHTAIPFDPKTATHGQVIAQGLAIFDISPAIWRVTEITVPSVGDAGSITGDVSFMLQTAGFSVVRNDVTSKRALLGPGEAYFYSGGDPYTTRAGGSEPSLGW